MSTNSVQESYPGSRLCHIVKWDHFDGYGFNLHAEKGKPGQYIGKVDEGSPAEAAGLREGDRILEVNGASIADKNHKQVVEAIKGLSGETKLLVVDPDDEGLIPDPDVTKTEKKEPKNGILNLNMTAAELRAKLKEKKRYDPKKEAIDFKKKFDIVQKL